MVCFVMDFDYLMVVGDIFLVFLECVDVIFVIDSFVFWFLVSCEFKLGVMVIYFG